MVKLIVHYRKLSPLSALVILLPMIALPVLAEDAKEATIFNDAGVRALNQGDFKGAIENLGKAVAMKPDRGLFRENLAIAYNNLGLKQKDTPLEAIKQFHRAAFLDPKNDTTRFNIDGIIKLLKKDPNSFADRVALAKDAKEAGDALGAIVEYRAALAIKDDAEIAKESKKLSDSLPSDQKLWMSPAVTDSVSALPSGSVSSSTPIAKSAQLDQYYQSLCQIEQQTLGRTYDDLIPQRLARLEKQIFGSEQSGSPRMRLDSLLIQAPASGSCGSSSDSLMQAGAGAGAGDASQMPEQCVSKNLETAWKQATLAPTRYSSVMISFKLNGDGSVKSLEPDKASVVGTSGNVAVDNVALEMVKQSSPYSFFNRARPDTNYYAIMDTGARSIKITPLPSIDYAPYMAQLQHKIHGCWHPPKGRESKRVTVVFKVLRDGTVTELRISETSGLNACDDAALLAVKEASPLQALPKGSCDVDIKFTFDYNVINKNKNSTAM